MTADVEFAASLDLGGAPQQAPSQARKGPPLPIYRKWAGSVPVPTGATPPLLVPATSVAAVPAGRIYNILGFAIFATDGHTALTGAVADVYLASDGVTLPDFSCQVLSGVAIPSIGWQSKEVIWAQPGERLIAMVYGFTAPVAPGITIMASVADYCIEDKEALHA